MRGAIPPLPSTPSWRGAQLSTGTALPSIYLQLRAIKNSEWNGIPSYGPLLSSSTFHPFS